MRRYTRSEKMRIWWGFWLAQDKKEVRGMTEYASRAGVSLRTLRRWLYGITAEEYQAWCRAEARRVR